MALLQAAFVVVVAQCCHVVSRATFFFCMIGVMCLCFQALKVLRCAEYAPYVVFIAAPRACDLKDLKNISVSDVPFLTRNSFLFISLHILTIFHTILKKSNS